MIYRPLLGKLLILISLCVSGLGWANDIELSQEYRIKSAYLFNFTKFISWPEGTFKNKDQALQLCVQDNQKISDFLHAISTARKPDSNSRRIIVKNITQSQTLNGCHIFYQTHYENPDINILNNYSCLVIGDTLEHIGSAITFFNDNRRVRFEVNLTELKNIGVTISSELLKLARINNKPSAKLHNKGFS